MDWRKWKQQKKEEKKKWKEIKLLKKLEKQRARELMEKEREEAKPKEDQGRHYTVSVAVPGSILSNAQSPELRTYLAGQIARACVIFCVDEIVVFDEEGESSKTIEGEFEGIRGKGQACVQLARILQYLECPQYLRKSFFPKHQDLQFAGLLNPLDSPHHVRMDEESQYREGVVLARPTKPGRGSFVNCGMRKEVQIDKPLEAGLRVTVRLDEKQNSESKTQKGVVISSQSPRTVSGLYWGYSVRLASCLSGTVKHFCIRTLSGFCLDNLSLVIARLLKAAWSHFWAALFLHHQALSLQNPRLRMATISPSGPRSEDPPWIRPLYPPSATL
ncbi:putative methyltransferase C9orf114 homolog isoform X4 [Python bivittatus]|uniref:28S rRNA (uridine-N(3))-methyltransferase n=1 Tax=Python bivittatus TaxID=176946 RepID=A0A9F5N078_PYTBI|nr:putative methyltransferase C9orf114 homolog isoform X4 [Python bivittatus]